MWIGGGLRFVQQMTTECGCSEQGGETQENIRKKRHGSTYCELLNMQPWGIQNAVCASYEECGLWKKTGRVQC